MDGLFIDSEPQWHAAEIEMMLGFGYPWSEQDQLHCLGGPLTRVSEYMSTFLNGQKSPVELEAIIIDEMSRRLSGYVPFMPGAIEFSEAMSSQGLPQALVSASPRVIVDSVLRGLKKSFFKVSVASGDIPRTKPYPDPYLHAAHLLQVDIQNCIIFEDSPTGITAAVASGAFVVAVPRLVDVQEAPRLKVIESFTQIGLPDLEEWSLLNQRALGKYS